MPSAPLLLSAAGGAGKQSRSASKAVIKAASGFHVFRIEGFSLTKTTIPGGEKISSQNFTVGGRTWHVDVYPNGTDSSKDESDSIALYLVYHGEQSHRHAPQPLNRLGAQYKFCLLDGAGNAAYELPDDKGVFKCSGDGDRGCGHDAFISRDELERPRARLLLKDDCLAIRCDVGVIDQLRVRSVGIGAKRSRWARERDDTDSGRSSSYSDDSRFDTGSSSYSGYSSFYTGSSSYSDSSSFDTGSSSYSDDSRFDTDTEDSWPRRRNKRRRRRRRQSTVSPDGRQGVHAPSFES